MAEPSAGRDRRAPAELPTGDRPPANRDPQALSLDEEALIERFARDVVSRRLGAAAIFFLESLRPMNFVLSQGMLFFSPLVHLLMKGATFDQVQELLEKRAALPAIVARIEQLEEDRRDRP